MDQESSSVTTQVIAIYGAILATFSFILSAILGINEIRKQKPRVKVTAIRGREFDGDGNPSEPLIFITAINSGNVDISVSRVGWLMGDGGKYYIRNPYLIELPCIVEKQRNIFTCIPCRTFRNMKDNKNIRYVFFEDETHRLWKGKINKKERKFWLKENMTGWKLLWNTNTKSYERAND